MTIDSLDLVGVLRASQALSSETSLPRLRVRMVELLRELTGATQIRGVIWYGDLRQWCLPPPLDIEGADPIPLEVAAQQGQLSLSAFRYVERTRQPLLVEDALRDDRFRDDPYFAGVERCSLLVMPIFNQDVLRLILVMENHLSHGAFTAGRLEAVQLIAGQLAVSIDNAMLYESLERKVAERTDDLKLANKKLEALSNTDPLTGLANRRRFNETIEAEWRRAIRPQTSIALAMIDIDQFKLYNDHYGHLGGDECLRKVARALGESIRGDADLAARYGGEEFVIVLPGADLTAAHAVAERARAAIEALQEPHEKSAHGRVTISVGIAAAVPTEFAGAETLIELADAALYGAKKNGRNQVVARKAGELPSPEVDELPLSAPLPIHGGVVGLSRVATAPPLRMLIIDDSAADAELILHEFKRELTIVQFERVDTAAALAAALDRQSWDVAICDYHLPGFGALPALAMIRKRHDYLPFIIVSGVIREETAVEAMKLGVDDYVLKSNLTRLVPAIRRELEANETRRRNRLAEEKLRESEERFRQIAENVRDIFCLIDKQTQRVLYVSPVYEEIWGRSRDGLYANLGSWIEGVHPDDVDRLTKGYDENMVSGWFDGTYRILRADGSIRWLHTRSYPVFDDAGNHYRSVVVTADITEQKTADEKIRRLNRVKSVFSGISALIVRARNRDELYRETCRIAYEAGQFEMVHIAMVDPNSKVLVLVASSIADARYLEEVQESLRIVSNPVTPEVLALHEQLFVHHKPVVLNNVQRELPAALKVASRPAGVYAACVLPLVVDEEMVGAFFLRAREAGFFDAEEVKLLGELAGDISFALDHLDKAERLAYLAYYDQLTGLANATLFRERLVQHLRAAHGKQNVALVLLDLERFKTVGDALGRQAGDALLKQVAERLVLSAGGADYVSRLGADHYAYIISGGENERDMASIIEKCNIDCFAKTFSIDGTELKVAAKMGISLFPSDATTADTLFSDAEAALKKAKAGGEPYLFYSARMNERVAERLALENKLRLALELNQFVLHYQPKVDSATGRIASVEALIRWNDPVTGLVPPVEFIPLMEETGLILKVGVWALRQAVRDHGRWLALGIAAPRIAVNVSAIQLRQHDFVDVVKQALADSASSPGIDIEITESLIMEDIEGNISKLNAIRNMGVDIAIDDFGTGYSSLAYLAALPVGTVKIDRSFIITMLQNPNTMTLVSTIISLAHSLGLKVVAEGVDQEEQATILHQLRCDQMQGYLFSKPVPFEEISTLITQETSRLAGL